MSPKVVVTGLGTINPLGHNVAETWANAVQGVSGVGPVTLFDASDLSAQVAAEVKQFDPKAALGAKLARRTSRFEQFGLVAVREALEDAGLEITDQNRDRIAIVVSSSVGGIEVFEQSTLIAYRKGPRRVTPFVIPMLMPNGAAGLISIQYGITGPAYSVASACASGGDGLGLAWQLVRSGMYDVVVAGASDSTLCKVAVAAFERAGAMSQRKPPDFKTPQPFDANRDGFVMGEGSAILILESEEHARRRGARILAEFAGYGASSDAYHVTAPDEEGRGAAKAMRRALEAAGLTPDDVDYINAHGTGTQLNDVMETKAIKAVFGPRAYQIPVSSTKSMTGHMMGATGALEAIFSVLAIRDGVVPPTINYETPDPECDLDYVPNQAREAKVDVVMSNSFGFGGHNAVLVFRRYTG
ncbi:MAG: beta-ketoacyl-ACP synthase II [Chloroflexi bacterium]|nr:beta-ketoacyl-ACP synthase II [Chloroflexota bacterium]